MLNYFKNKKGCLYGKSNKQKEDFFESLLSFCLKDPVFFKEQYNDLLPKEQLEFNHWLTIRNHTIINKALFNKNHEKNTRIKA